MRKSISKIALAASIMLAVALSLSCSSDDDVNKPDNSALEYSSSSNSVVLSSSSNSSSSNIMVLSSSSNLPPSSSSIAECSSYVGGVIYGTPVTYDGETYETVVIGSQTWMARNLNYNASGSKCPAMGDCKHRVYDWATAMALDSRCKYSFCYPPIVAQHQGICPSGWHLPTVDEWKALFAVVCSSTELKSTSGWYRNNNGTDNYGFSVLPTSTEWWTADEGYPYAYVAGISSINDEMIKDPALTNKEGLFGVRCIQDYSSTSISSSSVAGSNSSSVGGAIYGVPVIYGGETYETVVIGNQTWMARNLNYNADGSKCYGNDPAYCAKYGRLYNWATAMALDPSCNSTSCKSQISDWHKGICPDGWHLPDENEMWSLRNLDYSGQKLKATSGWNNLPFFDDPYPSPDRFGNGTDNYGFSALPGGQGLSDGFFFNAGYETSWWGAYESQYSGSMAGKCGIYAGDATVQMYSYVCSNELKEYLLLSVRCLKN